MVDSAVVEPAVPSTSTPQVPEVPVVPEAPKDTWDTLPEDVRIKAEPYVKPLKEKLATYEKELESAKSSQEKATALDRLVQEKDFQEWFYSRGKPKVDVKPKENQIPYTDEEYQLAYDKQQMGDPSMMRNLQKRVVDLEISEKITPHLDQLNSKAREIELQFELNGMMTRHPDAKDLDKFGFLEPALHYWTDKLKQPMEVAYQKAKEAYDRAIGDYKAKEAKEIQDKKGGVTERPGVVTADQGIQYLDSPEAVLQAQIRANMRGDKVQYRVRPRK